MYTAICCTLTHMQETSLITGASGGLGEEFAKLCAADKMNVVLVARGEEALKTLAAELEKAHGITATVIAKDLSLPNAAAEIVETLKKKSIHIDMLINNAGFGSYGAFHKTDFAQEKMMLEVNVTALTELTKLLLPAMVAKKSGKILNVASTAAFQPGPLMAVYYATKAYVLSFSEGIARELKGTGVTVTCLCPGPTKTQFAKTAHMESSRLFKGSVMDAPTVALRGYSALCAGKKLVVPGIRNRVGAFATRFVPISFAAMVAEKVQGKKK